jgi:RNA-directed DNA polymerase
MKRHGLLFDRMVAFENLRIAAHEAVRQKRGRRDVARFLFDLEPELISLQAELASGRYLPGAYRQFTIREPKERRISAAPLRDRVVHHAICRVIEPLFEPRFIHDSYACRKGKGTHRAVARAQEFARRWPWFLKCDVQRFYDSIDHDVLEGHFRRVIKDPRALELLDRVVTHVPPDLPTGRGIPIGNLTSQHFANIYLDRLDHFVKEGLHVAGYLRYMDDFVLFAVDRSELAKAKSAIVDFLAEELKLELNYSRTLLGRCCSGLPFLGLQLFPRLIRLRSEGIRKFKRNLARRVAEYRQGLLNLRRLQLSAASLVNHWAQADAVNLRRKLLEEVRVDA